MVSGCLSVYTHASVTISKKKVRSAAFFFRHFAFDAQEVAERVNGVLHQ